MIKIGIDAMGGDYAPEAVVLGAIHAAERIGPNTRIVLFGDRAQIEAIMEREFGPIRRPSYREAERNEAPAPKAPPTPRRRTLPMPESA